MNIKKCSLKTMCAALACTTFLSSILAAYATDAIITETPMDETSGTSDSNWTTEENSFEDIQVTYTQSSSYFVTIPKTIALDLNKQAAYSVKVTGTIDTKQRVYVAPVDGITETENLDFYMKEKDNKKADVVATVTQNKIYWNSEEVANEYEETNNSVNAPDLAAGTWEGTFQMEIRLETEQEQEHQHGYVDGKCECGEVDPNHEHNFVDGTCTICGEETDPYETAPASAYSNWNYTLDDTNNIITLNYYTGSETDVIVYANYVIGGKTYKTQMRDCIKYFGSDRPYMFNATDDGQPKCKNIKSIKFSKGIDTSNVTDMNGMFEACSSLISLDISGFDTSNVTNMGEMFRECSSLTSLDVSSFDTSNVTDMNAMFMGCAFTSLDLSNFNTSKVTNTSSMFQWCTSLTNLDLSSFDTSNVTNMGAMFISCSSLTSLDLSNFDTHNVTNMNQMFNHCSNLKTIYATEGKWDESQASKYNMFSECGTSSVTYK